MAMRLYSREDFESHLKENLGLTKTEHTTDTTEVWVTASGCHVTVPVLEKDELYPDFLFNDIYNQVEAIERSML